MSWLVELNDSLLPIALSIVGIIATGVGAVVSVRNIIKESHASKKNKLEDMKIIKNKIEEIKKSNRFIQELEINTIPFLTGFNWLEVEAIFKRNIGISTVKNLQNLSGKQLIALDDDKIYLPNRSYVFFSHIRYIKSIFLVLAFVLNVFWLFGILFYFPSNPLLYMKVLFLTLLLEVWMILNFDDLIIVNMMKKESYMERNNIYISNDFKEKLKKYETFKSEHYSMDKLKELNADSNDQATPEQVSDTNWLSLLFNKFLR